MTTILDVLDNFAGEMLTPERFPAWAADNTNQLADLWEHVGTFLSHTEPKQGDESSEPTVGIDLSIRWVYEHDRIPRAISTLLLYYPRIALSFPEIGGERNAPGIAAISFVPFLSLRPLVEKGVVSAWKPPHAEDVSSQAWAVTEYLVKDESFLAEVDSVRDLVFRETPLEYFSQFKTGSPGLLAMHYVYWMLLRFGTCSKWNLDAVPQGKAEWRSLSRAFQILGVAPPEKSDLEFDFSSILQDVTLPGLCDIDMKDIVRLRESEECFAFWRSAVTEAVRRIHTAEGISSERLADELREVLHEKSILVEESITKTSFRDKFVTGATTFALSSATILASTAAGLVKPGEEMAKLGIAAVLSALSSIVFGRTPGPKTALRKHIAAFTRA